MPTSFAQEATGTPSDVCTAPALVARLIDQTHSHTTARRGTAMSVRFVVRCLVAAGVWVPMMALGQTGPSSSIPRTAWDAPDLGGVWDYTTLTPLERPSVYEGREFLTEEETAQIEQAARDGEGFDYRASDPKVDIESAYNAFWTDSPTTLSGDRRTSLIVDPPDGRLPALTPAAQAREDSWRANRVPPIRAPLLLAFQAGVNPARSPEDFGLSERCIAGYSSGPPLAGLSGVYNSNLQIFQTPDHVALLTEMVHEARIVPLDARPHLSPVIRQWLGDARGYWDGDTLVVESTNFTPKRSSFVTSATDAVGEGGALHLTERFTRIDAETLQYEYTVKDPVTFTRPFTGLQMLRRTEGPIFEYACHEGNYGLPNAMSGARVQEREMAQKLGSGQE